MVSLQLIAVLDVVEECFRVRACRLLLQPLRARPSFVLDGLLVVQLLFCYYLDLVPLHQLFDRLLVRLALGAFGLSFFCAPRWLHVGGRADSELPEVAS